MKVLIIEDNKVLRQNIGKYLKIKGNIFEEAGNGIEGLEKCENYIYDIIILDINMPKMNGKEFLKELRSRNIFIPVLILTSNNMIEDKIDLFEIGADDYITKPFELRELELRLTVIIKRKNNDFKKENIKIGNVEYDKTLRRIFLDGKEIQFSRKEILIIDYLIQNRGNIINKTQLFDYVWGETQENINFSSVTLEAHISYIRKKIGKEFIRTIKGFGYLVE